MSCHGHLLQAYSKRMEEEQKRVQTTEDKNLNPPSSEIDCAPRLESSVGTNHKKVEKP